MESWRPIIKSVFVRVHGRPPVHDPVDTNSVFQISTSNRRSYDNWEFTSVIDLRNVSELSADNLADREIAGESNFESLSLSVVRFVRSCLSSMR